jgi:LAO/AO transport system kinase
LVLYYCYIAVMFSTWSTILQQKDTRQLARYISYVENEVEGYIPFLQTLPFTNACPVIGITGPPGAGKSTLTNALLQVITNAHKRVCVLCVDPSSPFNMGALLGDRIRMNQWYNNPNVFIRSLATRGSLGGLHPKIIEITDLLRNAWFDYIIIETVGVGQSEIEIAGLADITAVVLVPEAGDDIQTMKAGLMEIADIFIVNKADRPDADFFVNNLRMMLAPDVQHHKNIPVCKTVAAEDIGIDALWHEIQLLLTIPVENQRRIWLLTHKAWQLLAAHYTKHINKQELANHIALAYKQGNKNLYSILEQVYFK